MKKINAPAKILSGNLIVKPGEVYDYTAITGDIYVPSGGNIERGAFPRLTSVGGYIYAPSGGKIERGAFPRLTSVGGYIYADAANYARVKTNDSTVINIGSEIRANVLRRCQAYLLSSFAAAGFSFADGILAKIVSRRGPVSRVIICGNTEVSYIVTNGEAFSHGKTLAEARDGLLYKIGSRDTTPYKAWTLDRVVNKGEAIQAYRIITGACDGGVRAWMEQRQTPDTITVKEIIELTRGAFGADVFKAFFEGGNGK